MGITQLQLTNCVGERYFKVFNDIEAMNHRHYFFKGGRGSLKSSFVYIYTIMAMTRDALNGDITHCVAFRKVKDTIKDSVFANLQWAIDKLGLTQYWKCTKNPMVMSFMDNTILFRGSNSAQDHTKIKSLKAKIGYFKYAIFEELTEFNCMDEVLSIIQSLFRGGDNAIAFYMYNPPPSKNHWLNKEIRIIRPDRYIHSSTYLQAPKEWLGTVFIDEAEQLKLTNIKKYNHMYLGTEVGEGLEIYNNVTVRPITIYELQKFTKVHRGLDLGFTKDASSYVECYYDDKADSLYIFDEVYGHGLTNQMLYDKIFPKSASKLITVDSAEPRTRNELNLKGLNLQPSKKGKDSVHHGIKWLSDLNEIIIDKNRCPHTAVDFETYEYEKDKDGNIIYNYPKEPHASASVRYAVEELMLNNRIVFGGKR